MPTLIDHPTVHEVQRRVRQNDLVGAKPTVSGRVIRELVLGAGADDYGIVSLDRVELDDQRGDILAVFPQTKSLISFVCRMNRAPIRSTARSVANLEFHHTGERVNDVARTVVRGLEDLGYEAVNPSMGFPMEMDRFPLKPWVVSHKPIAVAAGLGQIGIHRNVIHPKYGNFILLGTILLNVDVVVDDHSATSSADSTEAIHADGNSVATVNSDHGAPKLHQRNPILDKDESRPIDFNPCLGCKLCVAACPVGAITPNGDFNFSACYAHNYREFMTSFVDWAERAIGGKPNGDASPTTESEAVSSWQSLSFGPNYKAAYCLAVCPAGEDVISPFLDDRGEFITQHVKPLQEKLEPIYVQPGSDAEEYVAKRFPHKEIRKTGYVFKANSIREFVAMMQHAFQPGKSQGLDGVFHFAFTGSEQANCTVTIREQKIEVRDGHVGDCDLRVNANSESWVRFLQKKANIAWLIATFRVRMKGDPRLLIKFGKCFP